MPGRHNPPRQRPSGQQQEIVGRFELLDGQQRARRYRAARPAQRLEARPTNEALVRRRAVGCVQDLRGKCRKSWAVLAHAAPTLVGSVVIGVTGLERAQLRRRDMQRLRVGPKRFFADGQHAMRGQRDEVRQRTEHVARHDALHRDDDAALCG